MKKVLLVMLVLASFSNFASAQTKKGTWLLGGSASYASQGDFNNWAISPSIGGFIKDNLAIGADVSLAGMSDVEGTSTTLAAYVKPYFGSSETNKWFAKGGIGSYKSSYMEDGKFAYGFGLGNASFLTKNIALEISANYTKIADFDDALFDLRVGFQIHMGGK